RAAAVLEAVGSTLWCEREDELDAVTAVSGSGPAYVFYFLEALEQAARELGFTPAEARRLSLATFSGSIRLAEKSDSEPALLRAPFRNPLGQAVSALTDWAVKPVRRVVPGYRGYDWASLLLAWLLQALWLAALMTMTGGAVSGTLAGLVAVLAVVELVKATLWIIIIAVFLQALLSWVAPDGPLAGVLNALTFRVLTPVRRVVPPLGGALDLSPP